MGASSSNYSEWNIDEKWSSQEWKSDELMEVRTGRLVIEQPPGLFAQHTDRFSVDDGDMATESNLSLKSQSFLHRVNDRLRKILDHSSKDAMQDSNQRSLIWWMFLSSALETSVFMGKNYSKHFHFNNNTGNDLTFKHIFDISEKLGGGQSKEIFGVTPIFLGRFFMETIIFGQWWRSHQSLACKCVCIFWFCVMSWKGDSESNINSACEENWVCSKVHHNTEFWTQLTASRWNSSGIFSQDSPRCSSAIKSKSSCQKWAKGQENLQDGSSSFRCSTTSHGELLTMNRNVLLTPHSCLNLQKRFPAGRRSFFGFGSEKKWSDILLTSIHHEEIGTESLNWC